MELERMWWWRRVVVVVVLVVELLIAPLFIEPLFIVPDEVPVVFRFELFTPVLFVPVAVLLFCWSIADCDMAVVSVVPAALVPLVPLTDVVLALEAIEPLIGSVLVPVALMELRFAEPAAVVPLFSDVDPVIGVAVAVVEVAAVLPYAELFGLPTFVLARVSLELGMPLVSLAAVVPVPLAEAIDVGSEPVVCVVVVLQPTSANTISSAAAMARMSLLRSPII